MASGLCSSVRPPFLPEFAGPYLESALARGLAPPERYEQVLAKLYLHELEAGTAGPAIEGKLRQLIRSGMHLDCAELLEWVPRDAFFQVRVALLERLGRCAYGLVRRARRTPQLARAFLCSHPIPFTLHRHLDALHIFIHTLKRPDEAEAYCDRIYSEQRRAEAKAGSASKLATTSDFSADWFLDAPGTGEEQSFNIYLLLIQVRRAPRALVCCSFRVPVFPFLSPHPTFFPLAFASYRRPC